MAEEQKDKNVAPMSSEDYAKTGSGGYENPMEEDITNIDSAARKTGSGADETESESRTSASPESASGDTVAGSPNQGTESR